MLAVVFSALVLLALVSSASYWTMRIRLMRADSARDRTEWLSFRSGDDVLRTYEEVFPRSRLPRFGRLVFWMLIVTAAVFLCTIIILKLIGQQSF
jgi:hypothetical protein